MEKCKHCEQIMFISSRHNYRFYCIECDKTGSKLSKKEIETYKNHIKFFVKVTS